MAPAPALVRRPAGSNGSLTGARVVGSRSSVHVPGPAAAGPGGEGCRRLPGRSVQGRDRNRTLSPRRGARPRHHPGAALSKAARAHRGRRMVSVGRARAGSEGGRGLGMTRSRSAAMAALTTPLSEWSALPRRWRWMNRRPERESFGSPTSSGVPVRDQDGFRLSRAVRNAVLPLGVANSSLTREDALQQCFGRRRPRRTAGGDRQVVSNADPKRSGRTRTC